MTTEHWATLETKTKNTQNVTAVSNADMSFVPPHTP